MKIIISLFFGLICAAGAYSQNGTLSGNINTNKPQIILPDTARYKIVSLKQISSTVKLDRYTGKTYIYFNERRKWYLLDVRGGLPNTSTDTPKFEICDEGEFIFLINNETGQSWTLNVRTWEPVTD